MTGKIKERNYKKSTKIFLVWVSHIGLSVGIALLVYLMGGATYSYTHLMYLPIILIAYRFGLWETIVMALISGLLIGPFMPQNVITGEMQNLSTWLFRQLMFVVVGSVGSLLSIRVKSLQKLRIERAYTNSLTNHHNLNKLKYDIDRLIEENKRFSVLGFDVVNISSIRQNTTYEMGTEVLIKALEMLSNHPNVSVYSIYSSEFGVIVHTDNHEEAEMIGKTFLKEIADCIYIEDYKIGAIINGGVIHYPKDIKDSADAVKKLSMILDQTANELGIHAYDDLMEENSKIQSELVPDLFDALKNDEFSLVFQPKVDFKDPTNFSVEALIRWHHPTKGIVSPGLFIPIAEETGMISEVTKTVISKVIHQISIWKQQGLVIKTSINISHKDFNNQEFLDHFIGVMDETQIDPSLIELEITERGVIDNSEVLVSLFKDFRKRGIQISLDDFGTGYNSLVNLTKIPMDFLKIDKSFIDYLNKKKYRVMIEKIIEIAHLLKIKVVAEGVETKEQLDLLIDMKCDLVQGYFISKPLAPDALIDFYHKCLADKKK